MSKIKIFNVESLVNFNISFNDLAKKFALKSIDVLNIYINCFKIVNKRVYYDQIKTKTGYKSDMNSTTIYR